MKSVSICTLVFFTWLSLSYSHDPPNIDQWAKSRQKRFLIYSRTGVQKIIVSFVLTVDLKDNRNWRSLAGAWNLQWQHLLPTTVLHWWNSTYYPANYRSLARNLTPTAPKPADPTAALLYEIIETYMNNQGMRGRECLQRSICENAQVDYVGGVMDRIYKRLLTPERMMEDHYKDAFAMGSKGIDCYETFNCPKGKSVLDQFVQIIDVD